MPPKKKLSDREPEAIERYIKHLPLINMYLIDLYTCVDSPWSKFLILLKSIEMLSSMFKIKSFYIPIS